MRLLVVQIMAARGSTSNGRDRVRVQLRGAQISHAQLHCLRLRRTNFDLCDKSAPQLFVRARCNPASTYHTKQTFHQPNYYIMRLLFDINLIIPSNLVTNLIFLST